MFLNTAFFVLHFKFVTLQFHSSDQTNEHTVYSHLVSFEKAPLYLIMLHEFAQYDYVFRKLNNV